MSHWQDKRTCGRGEAVEEKEEIRMSETRMTVARKGNVPMGREIEGKHGETMGENTGIESSTRRPRTSRKGKSRRKQAGAKHRNVGEEKTQPIRRTSKGRDEMPRDAYVGSESGQVS